MFLIFFSLLSSKSKKDSKQLFLFTNSEEPHSKFSNVHKHAERRFGDLQDDGVSVYLFPIGEDFDASKVYQVCVKTLYIIFWFQQAKGIFSIT